MIFTELILQNIIMSLLNTQNCVTFTCVQKPSNLKLVEITIINPKLLAQGKLSDCLGSVLAITHLCEIATVTLHLMTQHWVNNFIKA